jgi:hypothetical protein
VLRLNFRGGDHRCLHVKRQQEKMLRGVNRGASAELVSVPDAGPDAVDAADRVAP